MSSQTRPAGPQQAAFAILLVAGLIAGAGLVFITSAYVGSINSAGNLEATISDFRVMDDDNPRAEMALTLNAHSAIPLQAEKCVIELEFADRYMATSQSDYVGTNPATSKYSYAERTNIAQELIEGQPWTSQLTLYIEPRQMAVTRSQRNAGGSSWYAQVTVWIVLPYSGRRESITRRVAIQELSNP